MFVIHMCRRWRFRFGTVNGRNNNSWSGIWLNDWTDWFNCVCVLGWGGLWQVWWSYSIRQWYNDRNHCMWYALNVKAWTFLWCAYRFGKVNAVCHVGRDVGPKFIGIIVPLTHIAKWLIEMCLQMFWKCVLPCHLCFLHISWHPNTVAGYRCHVIETVATETEHWTNSTGHFCTPSIYFRSFYAHHIPYSVRIFRNDSLVIQIRTQIHIYQNRISVR